MSLLRFSSLLCLSTLASLALGYQDDVSSPILPRSTLDTCVNLKIMPLGASVTWGTDSSNGNGYRGPLEKLILNGGNNVVFVGTRENGDMDDNAVEAYPGFTISQVAQKSQDSGSYDYQPNVVLIHLGTNDCTFDVDTANAPTRMVNLVKQLTAAIPNALIIVSNLIPNLVPDVESCIQTVNSGFQDQVTKLANAGTKVVFADMHSVVPTSDINSTDKTHPNDDGYQKMAKVWYDAINKASKMIASPNAKGKVGYVQPQSLVQRCGASPSSSSTKTGSATTSAVSGTLPITSASSTSGSPTSVATAATPTRTNRASSLAGNGWLNANAVSGAFVLALAFWIFG